MDPPIRMRTTVVFLCLLLASRAGANPAFNRPFFDTLQRSQGLLSQYFSRSLPTPSPSSGVRYSFDPATATFEREAAVLGQVYVDRAMTLGRGHWNVSLTYQRAELDSIGGQDAHHMPGGSLIGPIRPPRASFDGPLVIRLTDARFTVISHQTALAGTYGITDDLDVSMVLPVVETVAGYRVGVSSLELTSDLRLYARRAQIRDHTNALGIGDLQVYGKQRLPSLFGLATAATLGLRFPTGRVSDLHGGGGYDVTPGVGISTPIEVLASWARLQGHFNAGVDFLADDVGASEPRWALGLDWGLSDGVTLGASFLGRHSLRRFAPAGSLDAPRCGPDFASCLTNPGSGRANEPIYGIDTGRPDYYDFAFGGRVSLWRDVIIGFASVIVPLNDGGIRTGPIPLVGVEATF